MIQRACTKEHDERARADYWSLLMQESSPILSAIP